MTFAWITFWIAFRMNIMRYEDVNVALWYLIVISYWFIALFDVVLFKRKKCRFTFEHLYEWLIILLIYLLKLYVKIQLPKSMSINMFFLSNNLFFKKIRKATIITICFSLGLISQLIHNEALIVEDRQCCKIKFFFPKKCDGIHSHLDGRSTTIIACKKTNQLALNAKGLIKIRLYFSCE